MHGGCQSLSLPPLRALPLSFMSRSPILIGDHHDYYGRWLYCHSLTHSLRCCYVSVGVFLWLLSRLSFPPSFLTPFPQPSPSFSGKRMHQTLCQMCVCVCAMATVSPLTSRAQNAVVRIAFSAPPIWYGMSVSARSWISPSHITTLFPFQL